MVDYKSIAKKWDFNKTVQKVKDTKNFEIEKSGRFAARFFQVALAVISYYFIAAQNSALIKKYDLTKVTGPLL